MVTAPFTRHQKETQMPELRSKLVTAAAVGAAALGGAAIASASLVRVATSRPQPHRPPRTPLRGAIATTGATVSTARRRRR